MAQENNLIDMSTACLVDFPTSLPAGFRDMSKIDKLKFRYEYAKQHNAQVRKNIIAQAVEIRRSIDTISEVKSKSYADECASKIEKCLETKWDPSNGPPTLFELPEKPSVIENGSAAIRYWNLMLDVSEKIAAFDEQTEETLDTFREALKRYGVEATPPRALSANAEAEMGSKEARLGEGTGKETVGTKADNRPKDPATGKGPGSRKGSASAMGSGEASTTV
ncbi:MAG: hypothetical protein M1813_007033 [Trichoglossum hirsutum]|nr:MAG: hypothetical protein M1813_007033 [Trichoglossum hirsutum]